MSVQFIYCMPTIICSKTQALWLLLDDVSARCSQDPEDVPSAKPGQQPLQRLRAFVRLPPGERRMTVALQRKPALALPELRMYDRMLSPSPSSPDKAGHSAE